MPVEAGWSARLSPSASPTSADMSGRMGGVTMEPDDAQLDRLLEPLWSETFPLPVEPGIAGHHPGEPGESVSVRTASFAGHHIRIETRYRIYIDDQLFPDPIHVSDDGSVHYHGLPQYALPSAVELLKRIVDRMPEGPAPPLIGDGGHPHGQPHHHGGEGGR